MAKKLQLQIPEPCHESWDKMTPVDKGRFCDSCQKAVVDFTGMSDAQLVAFFKKPSTGAVCGRFFDDQLNRDFNIPRKRIPWVKYFFQFTVPLFLTSLKTQAQGNVSIKERITPDTLITCTKTAYAGMVAIPSVSKKIMGLVTNEKGEAIPYATVYIKGTKQGAMCDSTGFFQLNTETFEAKITLTASCVGFIPTEKQLNLKKENSAVISLKMNAAVNGEVVVTTRGQVRLGGARSVRVTERTFLQKAKDYFVNDSVTVFPNPARSGSAIKIEIKSGDAEEIQIELLNLQGQLISSSIVNTYEKNSIITYQLPNIIAGSYLLRVKNRISGKTQTEKIIVQ